MAESLRLTESDPKGFASPPGGSVTGGFFFGESCAERFFKRAEEFSPFLAAWSEKFYVPGGGVVFDRCSKSASDVFAYSYKH